MRRTGREARATEGRRVVKDWCSLMTGDVRETCSEGQVQTAPCSDGRHGRRRKKNADLSLSVTSTWSWDHDHFVTDNDSRSLSYVEIQLIGSC